MGQLEEDEAVQRAGEIAMGAGGSLAAVVAAARAAKGMTRTDVEGARVEERVVGRNRHAVVAGEGALPRVRFSRRVGVLVAHEDVGVAAERRDRHRDRHVLVRHRHLEAARGCREGGKGV